MNKISILMPTYNDAKYIKKAIDSVLEQSHENWELLICDDGSTDNTKEVINNYISNVNNKIKYYYQNNADQLNAIIKLIPKITGDYVYILHSDDILYDKYTLEKMVKFMEENKVDSIISNMPLIDSNDNLIGNQMVSKYINNERIIPLQFLWLGRNLYVDMACHKKEIFVHEVYNNYLLWNGPFWLNLDEQKILNVKKVDFPFFKYRISDNNYVNSEGANLNIINGEIRVVTRLMKNYYIPLYKTQYMLYRIFNKLNLGFKYPLIYLKKETKNKYNILKFVLNKRLNDNEIKNNIFLNSLINFYKNNKTRKINIDSINSDIPIYNGKDMRIFNKKIYNNTIEPLYKTLFSEMEIGFNEIVVNNKNDYKKLVDITKFLCIYPYVKITIKNK